MATVSGGQDAARKRDSDQGSNAIWVTVKDRKSVVRIDAPSRTIESDIFIGVQPYALAAGEGAVWVVAYEEAQVVRIDIVGNRVSTVVSVPPRPNGVVAGAGGVWVRGQSPGQAFLRVDPTTTEVSEVPIPGVPVAVSERLVWIDEHRWFDTSAILRFDPISGERVEVFEGVNIWNVTPGSQTVWFTHSREGRWVIGTVDPLTGAVTSVALPLPHEVAAPRALASSGNDLVVAAMLRGAALPRGSRDGPFAVFAIDAEAKAIAASRELEEIEGIGMFDGEVWVSQHDRQRLLVLDRASMEVVAAIPLAGHPGPIATFKPSVQA